eukprot:CAMPEP_0182569668 /NCGR_PEP_ID=MMETSP1324-20130603/10227_1 /TAXON_ID=236786 /ORGANISM="Florenciella sp., Strain RCC1587" /LENGTH=194 /DNA_ID=CAMNT_0024783971 /DNA_START=851 /DNA_END=1435 /DNA_ORIENTATION=-
MAAPNIDWVENSLCHCARQAARNQLVDHLWCDQVGGTVGPTLLATLPAASVVSVAWCCFVARLVALPTVANAMSGGMASVLYGGAAPVGSGLGWRDGGTVESWATEVAGWDQRVKLACWRVGMLACWRVGATEVMVLSRLLLKDNRYPGERPTTALWGVAAEATGRTARNRWHLWLVGRSVRLCMNKRRRGTRE